MASVCLWVCVDLLEFCRKSLSSACVSQLMQFAFRPTSRDEAFRLGLIQHIAAIGTVPLVILFRMHGCFVMQAGLNCQC